MFEIYKYLWALKGHQTTINTPQLTNDEQIRQAKHYGLTLERIVYDIRKHLDQEKKIIKCFKCNTFGNLPTVVHSKKDVQDVIIQTQIAKVTPTRKGGSA